MCSGPDAPGLLQAAALIEARIARETHAGWLLTPVFVPCRKEAAAVALLAWVDHAAAGNLQLLCLGVRNLVLTVDATGTGLRRAQLWLVKCSVLVPLNNVGRHSSRVIRCEEQRVGQGTQSVMGELVQFSKKMIYSRGDLSGGKWL